MSLIADNLAARIQDRFDALLNVTVAFGEVTVEVVSQDLLPVCTALRDEPELAFAELIDLCGVDYLTYGRAEWQTSSATGTGFSRGVETLSPAVNEVSRAHRFAVVYHLLSIEHNCRLRLKIFLSEDELIVNSVVGIWASANWFEREAFDLFGILFRGHPDLRRILTDYGFIGHPFRKDFPLIGNVEMRYDVEQRRVIYEPVSIEPRVLVPKIIRDDQQRNTLAQNGKGGD
jgi:NADH-quinone oxidoreductase subunit C